MQKTASNKYVVLALLSAILFALSTPASKLFLNQNISPILLASLYYIGAAILLIPFSYKNFQREIKYLQSNRADLGRIVGATVFGGILGPIALLYGIKFSNATTASLLLNLETVATTFLAYFFFKEHIGKKVALASVLTVISGIILVIDHHYLPNWGGILVALGCLFWGFDNNFTATVEGVSPQTNTIIKGVVAGFFNLIVALIIGQYQINFLSIIYALIIGLLAYGISIFLYILSARKLGAIRSQIIFASNPFIAGLISLFLFKDILDLKFYLALIIMLVAMTILYYERHQHRHLHPEIEHEHDHSHDDDHHFHQHSQSIPETKHIHRHKHQKVEHIHPHYPDLHHRHKH